MVLGIDLGTSNSAIVCNDGQELKLCKTLDGADVLPSAVMIDRRGGLFVGRRAYEQEAFAPGNVARKFKRLMGTESPLHFESAGRSMSPEQASTEVLKTLLAQAKLAIGAFALDGCVITIPAAFNQMQCEATMRAAEAAGLGRVALVQEPIAAAMAALADRRRRQTTLQGAQRDELQAELKDGQFLVYDFGGGTFDAAIVQNLGGTITITGHAGINMLGGADFDRRIVETIVRPWLASQFTLPEAPQKDPAWQRVLRIAAFHAEKAKIELSMQDATRITADEGQIAARDLAGQEIYLDIPFDRAALEALVADQIDSSIDCCHQLLTESGYQPSDLDRIVFIGGPTRMPIVRSRVPQRLGIAADLESDPMTAVAFGAAIFAESRDWSGATVTARPLRATASTPGAAGKQGAASKEGAASKQGAVHIDYAYPERTSDARIRIRIKPAADTLGRGLRLQIDSDMGWSSGQLPLDETPALNDVPVGRRGDNQFRVMIFDAAGEVISEAETRLMVKRTDAASGGTPISHTIAVKVVAGGAGQPVNMLHPLVAKGQPVPASGSEIYRAAHDLRGGEDGGLDFEVYQMEPGVTDPALNLHVGAFRIQGGDLDAGDIIRRGDVVRVHWTLDENGLLNCALEVPAIGRRFDTGKMFSDQGARKSFEGEQGEALARAVLDSTAGELADLYDLSGAVSEAEKQQLTDRMWQQHENLHQSFEADTRRSVVEEARAIRQQISRIKNRPETIGAMLAREADRLAHGYDSQVRPHVASAANARFDALQAELRDALRHGRTDDARKSHAELEAIYYDGALAQRDVLAELLRAEAAERDLALDKPLHDRLVTEGQAALARGDLNHLRESLRAILRNRIPTGVDTTASVALAGLMK